MSKHTPFLMLAWCFSLLLSFSSIGLAQDDDLETPATDELAKAVMIDGRVLFNLRGISSFPAEKRVKGVKSRIIQLAKNRNFDPEDIRVEYLGDKNAVIMANSLKIVHVVAADLEYEGISDSKTIAEAYRLLIIKSINSYREERSRDSLIKNGLISAIGTLLFFLVTLLLRRAFAKLELLFEKRYLNRVKDVEVQSFRFVRAGQIRVLIENLVYFLRSIFFLVTFVIYIEFVLALLPWTRGISITIFNAIVEPLVFFSESFIEFIPNLIFLIILFFLVRWVLKMTQLFFLSIEKGLVTIQGFDPDWSIPTYRIVRIFIFFFALLLAYPHIPGSNSVAFKGLSVFMAVLASVGAPAIVSNIFAGYSLTYRRAFKIGDKIKVGDVLGEVVETRLMVTHLRTPKNEEVIIPNSTLLNSNVTNYSSLSRSEKHHLVLHTVVGIGYEVPWRQVEAMLLIAAERTKGLLKEPAPFVLQLALADYAVNYQLNAYCENPLEMQLTYSELHKNIQDVFNEYEVQIMTPSYIADTPDPKIVPKDQWYTTPAVPEKDV